MGVMDKMKFWKKEQDLGDLGDLGSFDSTAMSEMPNDPLADHNASAIPDTSPQLGPLNPEGTIPQTEQVMPSEATQSFGADLHSRGAPQPAPGMPVNEPQQSSLGSRDMEIINAKLDTIKASLDSVSARLANIERLADTSNSPRNKYTW